MSRLFELRKSQEKTSSDYQVGGVVCPDCPQEIKHPLARHKMYRHLLDHGWNHLDALELANKIPSPKHANYCVACQKVAEAWSISESVPNENSNEKVNEALRRHQAAQFSYEWDKRVSWGRRGLLRISGDRKLPLDKKKWSELNASEKKYVLARFKEVTATDFNHKEAMLIIGSEISITLNKAVEILGKNGIPTLVIGGAAVQELGYPRYTNDVDLVVPNPKKAEEILLKEGFIRGKAPLTVILPDIGKDVDLIQAGEKMNSSRVPTPIPTEVVISPKFCDLETLIDLKLGSYVASQSVGSSKRNQDRTDVEILTENNRLPREFLSGKINKNWYEQLWDILNKSNTTKLSSKEISARIKEIFAPDSLDKVILASFDKEAGPLNKALLPAALMLGLGAPSSAPTPPPKPTSALIVKKQDAVPTNESLDRLVAAIARAEGAKPELHNPGNIVDFNTGKIKKFETDEEGEEALRKQLHRISEGINPNFEPGISLRDAGLIYSNGDPNWAKNVSKMMGVHQDVMFADLVKGIWGVDKKKHKKHFQSKFLTAGSIGNDPFPDGAVDFFDAVRDPHSVRPTPKDRLVKLKKRTDPDNLKKQKSIDQTFTTVNMPGIPVGAAGKRRPRILPRYKIIPSCQV
jgi:hypothetical protein